MAFKNRIRLPLLLRNPQFPQERNIFTKANGEIVTLFVRSSKTYEVITDWLPEAIHERLAIALAHDTVSIEGRVYVGNVSLSAGYEIEYNNEVPSFLRGQAIFRVNVTPYDYSNDNCRTCDSVSQLQLQDDTLPDPLPENDSVEIDVFENDNICCYPFTAEIVTFNTTYLDSATISEDGIITLNAKEEIATASNVNLVTYRVTCQDGTYDEADVFGDTTGSIESCEPPTQLSYEHQYETQLSNEQENIYFTPSVSTPDSYEWQLFECSNLGTPIDTGTVTGSPIIIFPALTPGGCYVISIRSVCGEDNFSVYVTLEFTTPISAELCKELEVTANDGTFNRNAYDFSYMNCAGNIMNTTVVNLSTRRVCALTNESGIPVYFTADPEISYIVSGFCGGGNPILLRVGVDEGSVCSETQTTYYLNPPFHSLGLGVYVYQDSAMTMPVAASYVVSPGGTIYVTNGDGMITNLTGNSC